MAKFVVIESDGFGVTFVNQVAEVVAENPFEATRQVTGCTKPLEAEELLPNKVWWVKEKDLDGEQFCAVRVIKID